MRLKDSYITDARKLTSVSSPRPIVLVSEFEIFAPFLAM